MVSELEIECLDHGLSKLAEESLRHLYGEKIFKRASNDFETIQEDAFWIAKEDRHFGIVIKTAKELLKLSSDSEIQLADQQSGKFHLRSWQDNQGELQEVLISDSEPNQNYTDRIVNERKGNFFGKIEIVCGVDSVNGVYSITSYHIRYPYSTNLIPINLSCDGGEVMVIRKEGQVAETTLPITLSLGDFEVPLETLLRLHEGATISFKKPEIFCGVLYLAGAPFAEVDLSIVGEKAEVVVKNILQDTKLLTESHDSLSE